MNAEEKLLLFLDSLRPALVVGGVFLLVWLALWGVIEAGADWLRRRRHKREERSLDELVDLALQKGYLREVSPGRYAADPLPPPEDEDEDLVDLWRSVRRDLRRRRQKGQ